MNIHVMYVLKEILRKYLFKKKKKIEQAYLLVTKRREKRNVFPGHEKLDREASFVTSFY